MKANNSNDSKTLDVNEKTRFTDRMTVRMDPSVKKLLNVFSRKTGVSSCQIIHALLTGYLTAMGDKIKLDVQSPTINLTIERQVKRVRRYAREYNGGGVEGEDPDGLVDKYLLDGNCWVRVSAADGVNEHGHGVGCKCSWCRSSP